MIWLIYGKPCHFASPRTEHSARSNIAGMRPRVTGGIFFGATRITTIDLAT